MQKERKKSKQKQQQKKSKAKQKHHKEDYGLQPDSSSEKEDSIPHNITNQQGQKNNKSNKQKHTHQQIIKNAQIQQGESQAYQQIDIRQEDEMIKTHKRPEFLKRWDGISNELQISMQQLSKMSRPHQVYWQTKAKNMNYVIFMEIGKRQYTAFEEDALLLCDIFKLTPKVISKYLTISFWFKDFDTAKKQLFQRKVPMMVMNQVDDTAYRELNGIPKRQIQFIMTPGIHFQRQDTRFQERLIMSLFWKDLAFGMVVVDTSSNRFIVQEIKDDQYFNETRRYINKYRPVQLILPQYTPSSVTEIARQICHPFIVRLQPKDADLGNVIGKLRESNNSALFQHFQFSYQNQSNNMQRQSQFSQYRRTKACYLVWSYFDSLSLTQKIFRQGLFYDSIDQGTSKKPFFDSQVYQNLQIFRLKDSEIYGETGTLVALLDHCQTLQGKKLLKRWIDQPLIHQNEIYERQQAVEQLVTMITEDKEVQQLQQKLRQYSKLQQQLADLYHWSIKSQERKRLILTKDIKFEKEYDQNKNPAIVRLKKIVCLLKLLVKYQNFLSQIDYKFESQLMKKIVSVIQVQSLQTITLNDIPYLKAVPRITAIVDNMLTLLFEQNDELLIKKGWSADYDNSQQEITKINLKLENQLKKWRDYFQLNSICLASVRAKREIQIPIRSINKHKSTLPKDLIFTSQTSTHVRYVTPVLHQLSQELQKHEIIISQTYQLFLGQIMQPFCQYKYIWDIYVKSISQLDVLLSLAKASIKFPVRCMPKFNDKELLIKNGHHPGLIQVLQKVVPNTLELDEKSKFLLLSGPNMGGKSTLLKQTCLLAVIAQIGCYVPAILYNSIVFDQIFCRVGASDKIYEGKSTFYVELEQTKRIITRSTDRSLIVIDELGRGISTFDGMAIAEAIMEELLMPNSGYTLFSTHYTLITDRFRKNSNVKMMKMCYEVNQQDESIAFTYQLKEGIAENSFANNVARAVGLPCSILKISQNKARSLQNQTKRKKQLRQIYKMANICPSDSVSK